MNALKIARKVKTLLAKFLKARAAVREAAGRKALDAGDALVEQAEKALRSAQYARSKLIDKAADLAAESVEFRKEAEKLEG